MTDEQNPTPPTADVRTDSATPVAESLGAAEVFRQLLLVQREAAETSRVFADKQAKTNQEIALLREAQAATNKEVVELRQALVSKIDHAMKAVGGTPWPIYAILVFLVVAVLVLAGVQITGNAAREPGTLPRDVIPSVRSQ